MIPTDSSHCSSIPSTPKDSGTSPTPKLTSTSPPPAATPSTPTSTPQSHSPSTTVKNDPTSSPPPAQVSSPSNQSSSVPDSVKKAALDAHNSFRALHGAGELTWDDTVATYAVDQSSKCVFEHSNGPYGGALSYGLPLVIEDAYVLQRTWLLELALSPSPMGSTCGRVKPGIMIPTTQHTRTSPRSFGRALSNLDAPLPLVLLGPSTRRNMECGSFHSLLPIDLTCECRVELSTPLVQLFPTRKCRWSIRVRLLSSFYQERKLTWILFLSIQRECSEVGLTSRNFTPHCAYLLCR